MKMRNETWIWLMIALVLLILIFDGFGALFGFIKGILILVVLVLLIMFLWQQVKRKR